MKSPAGLWPTGLCSIPPAEETGLYPQITVPSFYFFHPARRGGGVVMNEAFTKHFQDNLFFIIQQFVNHSFQFFDLDSLIFNLFILFCQFGFLRSNGLIQTVNLLGHYRF